VITSLSKLDIIFITISVVVVFLLFFYGTSMYMFRMMRYTF